METNKPLGGFLKNRDSYVKIREDKYISDSRERLSKIMKKKNETTMIGALSTIEEHLGFLWGHDSESLTEEQEEFRDVYQKMRSEILDKGNAQSRNIDVELSEYDVVWKRHSIKIPVVPVLPKKDN